MMFKMHNKVAKLLSLSFFVGVLAFNVSCSKEIETLEARKDSSSQTGGGNTGGGNTGGGDTGGGDSGGGSATSYTYLGSTTIPDGATTNPLSLCPSSVSTTVVLTPNNPATDQDLIISFPGDAELNSLAAILRATDISYSFSSISATYVADDPDGDYADAASDCFLNGGYANQLEITFQGNLSNSNANLDTTVFSINLKCVNNNVTSLLCSGAFSGSTN